MFETLNFNLIDFCKNFSRGPKQGDENWHKFRKTSVGGSEIAHLFGQGYKTQEEKDMTPEEEMIAFARKKLFPEERKFKIECEWGNVFQSVAEEIFCKKYNTEVFGSEIVVPAEFKGAHYSPDGMCVVGIDEKGKVIPSYLSEESNFKKCLVEIKCPFMRYSFSSVPSYYLPQVKDGLFILKDQVSVAIFIENAFRPVPFDRFFIDDDYCVKNCAIDRLPASTKKVSNPVALGILAFYGNEEIKDEPTDLADCDIEERNAAFENVFKKEYTYEVSPLIIIGEDNIEDDPQKLLDYLPDGYISYLPWKLLNINVKTVYPDEVFNSQIKEKIDRFLEIIEEIKSNEGINSNEETSI